MARLSREQVAAALGGELRREIEEGTPGPLDLLLLARAMALHLAATGGGPGRPSPEYWTVRRLVPFRRATWDSLKALAASLRERLRLTPSPAQVAAALVERDVALIQPSVEHHQAGRRGARLSLETAA